MLQSISYDIMEVSTEKKTAENENEIYSLYTYCRTEVLSKTLTSVWNLHGFWTIYDSINILKLNADGDNLPYEIILQIDRKDEKFTFHIKCSTELKHCTYNILLQSVTSNNFYSIPSCYNSEVISYEVNRSLFMEQLKGFVSRNILRVVVKVCYIECIVHNTMRTTTLRDYTVHNYKTDIKDLPICDPSTFVTFKVNEKKILINIEALCARSSYFRELFNGNMQENRIICVDHVPLDVVIYFQTFIQQGNTSFLKYADVYKLFSLFTLAKTYVVKDLQTICEQYLKELLLQKENVYQCDMSLDVLLFAYENEVRDLLEFTVSFIAVNINDHVNTKKFSEIIHRCPVLLTLLKQAQINTSKAHYTFE